MMRHGRAGLAAEPEIDLQRHLGAATAQLSQRLGHAPTASELAAELGMDRNEVVDGLIAGSCRTSPQANTGGAAGGPAVTSHALSDADASLDQIENCETLRPLLAALPDDERIVLMLRLFGSLPQTQIARRVGISPAAVSRLLAVSLASLRGQLP